mmetsp:Transcript_85270/g.246179  ORF Transcript_85270/g.246179 Transcript_85270/m.246179 type:complete len:217 (+) Transcript_85270:427-1077(+)
MLCRPRRASSGRKGGGARRRHARRGMRPRPHTCPIARRLGTAWSCGSSAAPATRPGGACRARSSACAPPTAACGARQRASRPSGAATGPPRLGRPLHPGPRARRRRSSVIDQDGRKRGLPDVLAPLGHQRLGVHGKEHIQVLLGVRKGACGPSRALAALVELAEARFREDAQVAGIPGRSNGAPGSGLLAIGLHQRGPLLVDFGRRVAAGGRGCFG